MLFTPLSVIFSLFGSFSVDNLRPAKQAREYFVRLVKIPFPTNFTSYQNNTLKDTEWVVDFFGCCQWKKIYYGFCKTGTKSIS